MQLLGLKILYREGGHEMVGLVTHVHDEANGIVNLSAFPPDGGCVGRLRIAPGKGDTQWEPLERVEMLAAEFVDGAHLFEGFERELAALRSQVAKLQELLMTPTITGHPAAPSEPLAPPATPTVAE
jgi:hypothetical protein